MGEGKELVVIIGAGRSGTTWLHLMLGSHPRIATGQESQVFARYLAPLMSTWEAELAWPDDEGVRQHGISSYLTEDAFIGLLRHFALEVFGSVLAEKPSATHLLEKSPNSSFHVELIHRCLPEVRFIHVLRDGRDVAASMLGARSGWGRSWAPSHVEQAASEWRHSVEAARKGADLTPNYTEIRYEDMLENGVDELVRLFDFVGLPVSTDEASSIYEAFSFDRLKSGRYQRDTFKNPGEVKASGTHERKEPPGFFRKGRSGTWREELSRADVAEFMWVAGGLLEELGYLTDGEPRPSSPPARLRLRHVLRNGRGAMARMGKRVLGES